jgi:hypothetical protein
MQLLLIYLSNVIIYASINSDTIQFNFLEPNPMSLFDRVKMIIRAENTARNQAEHQYKDTYIPFMGKCLLDIVVNVAYKDLFLAAFKDNVLLNIGVLIGSSRFIAFNEEHGLETFLLELEYNSTNLDDVADAPKDLYKYNEMSRSEISSIEEFIKRQVEFRAIASTEAEGEIHAMIMICSIMFLCDFVLDVLVMDLSHQHQNGVDVSEIPLPYNVDLGFVDEDDMDFQYLVEMNGVSDFAESINIPVYPPFSPQMAGVRGSVLEYVKSLNEEWYQLFDDAFRNAESNYTNQLR